jgi:hypothetical protein
VEEVVAELVVGEQKVEAVPAIQMEAQWEKRVKIHLPLLLAIHPQSLRDVQAEMVLERHRFPRTRREVTNLWPVINANHLLPNQQTSPEMAQRKANRALRSKLDTLQAPAYKTVVSKIFRINNEVRISRD